jgi:hypothetical protein
MFGNSLDQGKRLFTRLAPVLIRSHRLSSFKVSFFMAMGCQRYYTIMIAKWNNILQPQTFIMKGLLP